MRQLADMASVSLWTTWLPGAQRGTQGIPLTPALTACHHQSNDWDDRWQAREWGATLHLAVSPCVETAGCRASSLTLPLRGPTFCFEHCVKWQSCESHRVTAKNDVNGQLPILPLEGFPQMWSCHIDHSRRGYFCQFPFLPVDSRFATHAILEGPSYFRSSTSRKSMGCHGTGKCKEVLWLSILCY